MKSMNDMTMEELLEADRKINRHFFEEANFQRRRKTVCPPEWAVEMDEDEEFQKRMGALETEIECKYCGRWTKSVSSFCSPECKRGYIEYQSLLAADKKRRKTQELMNGGK